MPSITRAVPALPTFDISTTIDLKDTYGKYCGLLKLERSHFTPEDVDVTIGGHDLDGQEYAFTAKAKDLSAVLDSTASPARLAPEFILQPITPLERE